MTMTATTMPEWMQNQTYRFGIDEYHRLVEAGVLPNDIELLEGILVQKVPNSPLHATTILRISELLRANLQSNVHLRLQFPITIGNSEPEPDIAIVSGNPPDFLRSHPTTALFIIEVAQTSLTRDRAKAELYAQAGVAEYWIVNLDDKTIEQFTKPTPKGYKNRAQHLAEGELAVPGCQGLVIRVADALG